MSVKDFPVCILYVKPPANLYSSERMSGTEQLSGVYAVNVDGIMQCRKITEGLNDRRLSSSTKRTSR